MQKKDRKAVFLIIPSALFLFVLALSVCVMASNSQNHVNDCQCRGIDKSGAAIDQDILSKRLHDHKLTQSAGLSGVSTYCCNFSNQNLSHIIISGATLVKANFQNTDLTGVNLTDADLTDADLSGTTLSGVTLIGTKINGAKFDDAFIDEKNPLIFEPEIKDDSYVDAMSLAKIRKESLRALRFQKSSLALELLLKKFDDSGFHSHTKEIIYAIKKSQMDISKSGVEDPKGYVSYGLKFVLFEITCQWGLYPIRCLYLIILTILVFSFPYMIALGIFKSRTRNNGEQSSGSMEADSTLCCKNKTIVYEKQPKNCWICRWPSKAKRIMCCCFGELKKLFGIIKKDLKSNVFLILTLLSIGYLICFVSLIDQIWIFTIIEITFIFFVLSFSKKCKCILILFIFLLFFFGFGYIIFQIKKWQIDFIVAIFAILILLVFIFYCFLKFYRSKLETGEIRTSDPSDCEKKKRSEKLIITSPCKVIFMALYFSLISAFNIGWRELNIGDWITRIQPHDYSYKATGWVKVVAGIESLICTYLLALWVLTYFGSPFNW